MLPVTMIMATALGLASPKCVTIPTDLPEPVRVHGSDSLQIIWGGKPVVENEVTALICGQAPTHEFSDQGTVLRLGPGVRTVKLSGPWNRLPELRANAVITVPPLAHVSERLAACSDGADNDGDGLTDEVDPGCASLSDDDEDNMQPTASTLAFSFATEKNSVYLESLTWKGIPVIKDPGSGKGNRFYLHSDAGSSGKWTSDIQTFEVPLPNDPYKLPPGPWQPNTTTWKNQTTATRTFSNDQINSEIVSQNDTVVVVNTTTPAATFIDTFRFGDDTITVTTDVTNLMPATTCANGAATIYFGTHFGNVQLGTTSNCKCPATLISGHGSADGHGQANNCTAACASGLYHLDGLRRGSIQQGQPFNTMKWPNQPVTDPTQLKGWRSVAARGNAYPQSIFSPVTALGDDKAFTIGIQVMNKELNPDNVSTYLVEYYDIPAAPTKPLLSQYVTASMLPGETHTFNYVIKLGSPGQWAAPQKAVAAVLEPYTDFFGTTFGKTPGYCPQGAIGMAFRGSGKKFNQSTKTYVPGSSLYTDVLGVDSYATLAPLVGMDTAMIWQGQIHSSLLMKSGSYEFNPNSQTLDPHVNEMCDTKWSNVTKTLAANKMKLGWFGRPCSHIMQPDLKSPATVTCPDKNIETGSPYPCNLKNLSDFCTLQSMATVDALISKGVQNFYWDSYLCAGRMTFSQAVIKKYPHSFIMGEQGIDVDSILTGGLPWMGMQAGVWDPSFEPMNSVLQNIVNPLGTAIVGAFGADSNINHTMYSLQSAKTNSVMLLIPNELWSVFPKLPADSKNPPTEQALEERSEYCAQLKLSAANAQWRWEQYGKARGCPQPLAMDPSACGPLPPIGFVCTNATARAPAKCIRGWPSTHTNATCSASCKSTLGNCTATGCVPCTTPGPKCTYTCHETCKPHQANQQ